MKCKVCGSDSVRVGYQGPIRDGVFGQKSKCEYEIFECGSCGVFWHDIYEDATYYESEEYRIRLEKSSDIGDYYRLHDAEVLEKLSYTGTAVFRDRVVADVGCAGGSFLDFVRGSAAKVIAVEPSAIYRKHLSDRGYETFAYQREALDKYVGILDVVTSFDVIEHTADPLEFAREQFSLLKDDGTAICGTPSSMPAPRKLLPEVYEPFLFSVQHPWGFSEQALALVFQKAGFQRVNVQKVQRYGLANLLHWLKFHAPKGHMDNETVTPTADYAWRNEMNALGLNDYFVVKAEK